MKYDAVLFDLGNTIINNINIDLKNGFNKLIQKYNINCQNITSSIETILQLIRQRNDFELPAIEILQIFEELLNFKFNDDYYEVEYELLKYCSIDALMDGVLEVLEYLKNNNIRMGIVSNSIFSSQCLERWLCDYKILYYFEFVISSSDVIYRKPTKQIFETSYIHLNNIDKKKILFIGDSFDIDYVGATSFGFDSILINQDKNEHTINKLTKLIDIVRG